MNYRLLMFFGVLIICLTACTGKSPDKLVIGIIPSSINHLPLSYSVKESPDLVYAHFSSGWEVQEALIAGKVDAAIMPFSYAWNSAARGYPIRIVSFLERESDAILSHSELTELRELHNAKIGLLKASTVELLMDDLAQTQDFKYQAVYFRTPNDMVAALQTRQVDAIVAYVPIIQKLGNQFSVLHWFGDSHPHHPCCDIVVNKESLTDAKLETLKALLDGMESVLVPIDTKDPELISYMQKVYKLDLEQSHQALKHTGFATGLDEEGKALERKLINIAVKKGYQLQIIEDGDIYWELP